jgi:hypothetical protein
MSKDSINIDEYEMDSVHSDDIEKRILEKVKLDMKNNNWTDRTEKIILNIGQNARNFKNEHENLSRKYNLLSKLMNVILIIISTILSAQTFTNINANSPLDVIKKILTIVINIISVLTNFLSFDKFATQHNIASSNFSVLYHDIQQQLIQERKDRVNGIIYTGKTLKRYDDLILSGPPLKYTEINTSLEEIIIDPNTINYIKPLNNPIDKRSGTIFGPSSQLFSKRVSNEPSNHLAQLTACHDENKNMINRELKDLPEEKQKQIRQNVAKQTLAFELERSNNHSTIND